MILIILIVLAIFFPLLWIIVVPLILVNVGVVVLNRWADKANEEEQATYLIHWFYSEFLPEARKQIHLDWETGYTETDKQYPMIWIYNMAQLYERDFKCPEIYGGISILGTSSGLTQYDWCSCTFITEEGNWADVILISKETEDGEFYTGMKIRQVESLHQYRAERSIKIGKVNKNKLVKD